MLDAFSLGLSIRQTNVGNWTTKRRRPHDAVSTLRRNGGRVLERLTDEPPHHTTESARDIILNSAALFDAAVAEDWCKQNLRKLEILPSVRSTQHSPMWEQRRLTSLVPFNRILAEPGTSEAVYAFGGSNSRLQSMAVNCSALGGFWLARSL